MPHPILSPGKRSPSLSISEYEAIARRLQNISQTWRDLWNFLPCITLSARQTLVLTFADCGHLILPDAARDLITQRRTQFPEDAYLFQSHSNRVKHQIRPVTLVAFNQALRIAAAEVTDKNVSSKCARNVLHFPQVA